MMRILLMLVGLLLAATTSFAQQVITATPTQQSATDLQAATVVGTSVTSASTITIAAVSNMYFYVTGIEITNCAGSSAVTAAAVTSVTTTNLGGAAWTVGSGATAGLCQPSPVNMPLGRPIKSAVPGTAVTFVLPTFATNQTVRVSVYGYYAQ